MVTLNMESQNFMGHVYAENCSKTLGSERVKVRYFYFKAVSQNKVTVVQSY